MIPEPDQVDDSHETRACGPDGAAASFADSRVLVMDTPTRDVAGEMAAPERLIGSDVGGYRVKRVIASGGMGTVYLASQQALDRIVALKVMSSYIGSATALRRFQYESQVLARLRHPNIAQVHEAGIHDDGRAVVPFFAMEYVSGARDILSYADEKMFGIRGRVRLFLKVCEAVHHGHQKGIVHRDLKPANILVDDRGEPKVIDFGIARSLDSDVAITTVKTGFGELLGTLQYMSPEQCAGDPHDIDTRSDVYTLGVVLYELMCGQLPYSVQGLALDRAFEVIRETLPPRPGSVNRGLCGDVESIILKSLEKDRLRRYQSASALVAELQRFLNFEPIAARPPSTSYRFRKYLRRHHAVVLVAKLVTTILTIVAIIFATLLVNRAVEKTKSQTRIEGLESQITALRERVAELEAEPASRPWRPVEAED